MKTTAKVGVAIAGGYVLGRRKKAKMAIALGSWLVGKKLNTSVRGLAQEGIKQLASSPEVAKLGAEVKSELMAAGRNAANTAMTNRVEHFSDALQSRTAALGDVGDKADESKGKQSDEKNQPSEKGDEESPR